MMEEAEILEDLEDSSSLSSLELICEVENASEDSGESAGGIEPYRYEPYTAEMTEDSGSDNGDNNTAAEAEVTAEPRQGNTDWCHCGQCVVMDTEDESVCCREQQKVLQKIPDSALCILDHHNFHSVCLNEDVLEVAYYTYKHYRNVDDGNNWKRYTAYRQFIRWCYHYLGYKVRVPIPACVVNTIRQTFPIQEQYVGFRYADMLW